jgi:hypothetical protein
MAWIKRNLYFLIGSLVALALMGLAGWFLYSKWDLNNQILAKLNQDYEDLRQLNSHNPHPGSRGVDNIKLAKEQQQEVRGFIQTNRTYFQRIPAIPDVAKVTDRDFSASLSRTIDQLQHDAAKASVTLMPSYAFSFQAEKQSVSFAAGSLGPLAVQLGEVKAICDVLFQAKINSLDAVRRERVSADDYNGPQADYLPEKTVTNELAVLTPYELTFRCFSSELAAVLSGLASSTYGLTVKTVNVELAPASASTDQTTPTPTAYTPAPYVPQPVAQAADAFALRYGTMPRGDRGGPGGPGGPGGVPFRGYQPQAQTYAPQVPTANPGATAATASRPGALPTVLDEKQLKITMMVIVVKLLPAK